jgi:hypothetical protein
MGDTEEKRQRRSKLSRLLVAYYEALVEDTRAQAESWQQRLQVFEQERP